jgi:alpha-tubulin suppressor-like RCC1 family protein
VVAVTSEGSVYSFGKNEHGCLGVPVREDVLLPQRVTGLDGIPITWVRGL